MEMDGLSNQIQKLDDVYNASKLFVRYLTYKFTIIVIDILLK